MLTFATKKTAAKNSILRCLSLDDVMPPKISSNPLQKFRSCAGMKVNRGFNGAHTVYNILCATLDRACERSITPCNLKSKLWNIMMIKYDYVEIVDALFV